eukprot:m51a1_g3786 hypothetical protein (249) ;mRNA; r:174057-175208
MDGIRFGVISIAATESVLADDSRSIASWAALCATRSKECTRARIALERRMADLHDYCICHSRDERALVFEQERFKIRQALEDFSPSPAPQRDPAPAAHSRRVSASAPGAGAAKQSKQEELVNRTPLRGYMKAPLAAPSLIPMMSASPSLSLDLEAAPLTPVAQERPSAAEPEPPAPAATAAVTPRPLEAPRDAAEGPDADSLDLFTVDDLGLPEDLLSRCPPVEYAEQFDEHAGGQRQDAAKAHEAPL